ncbi:MAG: hypothetical protein FJ297_09920 [Planctomycetes bacterium]|nr:hypothetical protein [Planctomycetota bacterium]
MTAASTLDGELRAMALRAPPSGTIRVPWGRGSVECDVAAADAIGCSVDRVRIAFLDPRGVDAAGIRSVADTLCRKLKYLMEPLEVLEVETDPPTVQARSRPPSSGTGGASYYELRLARDSIVLVRFQAARGAPRIPCAMQLTREVLVRLVDDLVAAAEQLA